MVESLGMRHGGADATVGMALASAGKVAQFPALLALDNLGGGVPGLLNAAGEPVNVDMFVFEEGSLGFLVVKV